MVTQDRIFLEVVVRVNGVGGTPEKLRGGSITGVDLLVAILTKRVYKRDLGVAKKLAGEKLNSALVAMRRLTEN